MINTYKTKMLSSNKDDLIYAAGLLSAGEVVGIPTETVYGLAADATNVEAVAKIFKAKGRPSDNPLIVHISDVSEIEKYVSEIPALAYKLADEFCPGPLTMVMKKRDVIPSITSGELDTVGIRIPYHKTARELIKLSGKPLAAPSANLSGSPSPTSAIHVFNDMNGRVPAIVDGGVCPVGVESTVISFENDGIRLLRPGFITVEDFENMGIVVYCDKGITEETPSEEKVLSPGMKYKHYSPKANVTIINSSLENFNDFVEKHNSMGTYAMIFDYDKDVYPFENFMTYGGSSKEQAAQLFDVLRKFDEINAKQIYVRCPSIDGVGLAVYNRLLRAAGFEVIQF